MRQTIVGGAQMGPIQKADSRAQTVERMIGVFDPAIHVHAAVPTGVTLDGGRSFDDPELVRVLGDGQIVPRHDRDLREQGAFGLPTFAAAADVVVPVLSLNVTFSLRIIS